MSFKSLFGNFEHQNDGGSKSIAERQRKMQDVILMRKRISANIERRRKLLAALNAELLPLFQHYKRICRDKTKTGEAQRLLQKIAPLEKRIRKEESELGTDERFERISQVAQSTTDDSEARGQLLVALREAAPYVRGPLGTTMTEDEATDIISNITDVQLETNSQNASLSTALSTNIEALDRDVDVDADAGSSSSITNDPAAIMARLADRFSVDDNDELPLESASSTTTRIQPTNEVPVYNANVGAELFPQTPNSKPKLRNQPVAIAATTGRQHKFVTFDDDTH